MAEKLSEQEHIALAKAGVESSWKWLLNKHKGAIWAAVRKRQRHGADEDDALSHAHELFVKSVRSFDPDKGVKFLTYVWAAMQRVRRSDRGGAIYVPVEAWKTYPEAYERGCSAVSLDAASGEDGSCLGRNLPDRESSDDSESLDKERSEVRWAINRIPKREAEVLRMRAEGLTLAGAGKRIGVSRERIRQLEQDAIHSIRRELAQRDEQSPQQANETMSTAFHQPDQQQPMSAVEFLASLDVIDIHEHIAKHEAEIQAWKALLKVAQARQPAARTSSADRPRRSSSGSAMETVRQMLANGPMTSKELIERVVDVKPATVQQLLSKSPEFVRSNDGRWRLADSK